ncbi:MAG: DsbA family protein [Nitrospira sp.]|nr:DsbA family protein [Nitrospira sp.]
MQRRLGCILMEEKRVSPHFIPFILYSDFNCPFCYALHERLHDMKLIELVAWRGVQHAPYLPSPMRPWEGALRAELRHEVAVVKRLAPDLGIELPNGKPNTKLAIDRASWLLSLDVSRGMEFIRGVYSAFWRDGMDISDQEVLDRLAGRHADAGILLSPEESALSIVHEWEESWHATGQAGVPLLVSPDDRMLIGCVPPEQIERFFG